VVDAEFPGDRESVAYIEELVHDASGNGPKFSHGCEPFSGDPNPESGSRSGLADVERMGLVVFAWMIVTADIEGTNLVTYNSDRDKVLHKRRSILGCNV
jgi:hypothetical protein